MNVVEFDRGRSVGVTSCPRCQALLMTFRRGLGGKVLALDPTPGMALDFYVGLPPELRALIEGQGFRTTDQVRPHLCPVRPRKVAARPA